MDMLESQNRKETASCFVGIDNYNVGSSTVNNRVNIFKQPTFPFNNRANKIKSKIKTAKFSSKTSILEEIVFFLFNFSRVFQALEKKKFFFRII